MVKRVRECRVREAPLFVTLNWFDELRRQLQAK